MKILFIIPGLSIGGQEKIGKILTDALMQYHEVVTVCFEPKRADEFEYKTPIIRIVYRVKSNPLFKLMNIAKRSLAIRKIKKTFKPDVSIAFGETAILANAFTYTNELKIAALHQSVKYLTQGRALYKRAYMAHDKIVPVSSGINKELKEYYGIENELYINNGYDIEAVKNAADIPLPQNERAFFTGRVLVHLGRFDQPKGHWHLVMVFAELRKLMPGVKLLLIGDYEESNPIFKFCMDYLRKENCNVILPGSAAGADAYSKADVMLTGHLKNPFMYLKNANLFVFTSLWEGFGNAIVEAMACGIPVISSDCPTGPKEILTDKNTKEMYGILMPVFRLDFNEGTSFTPLHREWAERTAALLSNETEMQHYQQQSLKRCPDFTIEKSAEKWLKLIAAGKTN